MKGFYHLPGQSLMWQGGETPRDGPVPIVLRSTLAERIIAGMVSSIGILSTIYFFVFNFYYYKHPVVKRSSYRLNSLILVGVFIGFTGTVLHIIHLDSDMPEALTTTVCNARGWTTNLTFVLAFGTLFAKVWRLYKLFFNKKMVKRKYLHDQHLFIIVAIIVAPTLVTLIVQVATFPLTLHTVTTVNKDDFSIEETYSECKGTHEFVFLSLIYAGEIILALVSVILAFQTQKHSPKQDKYRKYHESAVINLTTIFALLLSSICQVVLIIFWLNNIQEGLLLIVTLRDSVWMYPMIYLLFAPKVYRVYSGSYKNQLTQQVSAVGTLFSKRARFSLSSGAGTKSSSISTTELISSGRESSDMGIGSVGAVNSGQDEGTAKLVPLNVTNREALFSPILEHKEECYSEKINPDPVELTVCLASNTMNAALELHKSNET